MQVELGDEGRQLHIRFLYDESVLEVVRGLPGRRWHPAGKYWSVPSRHLEEVTRSLLPLGFALSREVRRELRSHAPDLLDEGEVQAPVVEPVAAAEAGSGVEEQFDDPLFRGAEEPPPDTGSGRYETEPHTYTISELNLGVRSVLAEAFPGPIWVQGEVIGFDRNAHKKHVYFQLAEKEQGEDRSRAVVTTVLFAGVKGELEQRLAAAPEPLTLRDGIALRILGRVDLYPPAGSYQIIVEDIDPEFTLGEIARRRERILAEVERLGLRERNLSLPFPTLCLRVGLLTSLGSDAYNDFLNELERSRYPFRIDVADCHVQGDQLRGDLLGALARFARDASSYDVVAIVRGGGARTDLMGFDSLDIALAVARHPVKVVVGIGHHRDRGVLDFIAHSEKTPTAVAKALVELTAGQEERLEEAASRLSRLAASALDEQNARLSRTSLLILRGLQLRLERAFSTVRLAAHRARALGRQGLERGHRELAWGAERIATVARQSCGRSRDQLHGSGHRLSVASQAALRRARERIELRQARARAVDPQRILARGFAWLRRESGSLKKAADARIGDRIEARLQDGSIEARIEDVHSESPPREDEI